ncbi:Structural maintenance of chromosomes protein 5 [Ascosphaera atra]|nr:Structural maintenance of chromosomes protein 5 [Ascosphaera atra]
MLQWHEELVELRKSQKEALGNHVRHKAMLADLERKHESQREEVERVRQRADIKKRIEQLEQFKPVVLNSELARQAREAKEQARALKAEEEELKSQVAPILESANAKKQYYRKLEAVVRQRRHAVSVAQATAERAGDHAKQLEDKIDDLTQAINNERGNFSKFREEKQKLTQSINRIQRQLEEEEPEFNAATYNERLRDLVRQIRDLDDKLRELESQRSEANQRHRNKDNEIQSLENRHRNLESQSGQREEMLRHVSMDTYNAWQWVKENQDKFQNQVFGPPLVECSVRDLQYADIVESVMGRNDFQAFTTQSRDDFRTLQRAFAEHRWQDVSIRTTTVSLEQLRPPVGNDELERLGFEHWVKDLLTGPEPVIAMLCSESNLHSVPVTLRELSEAEYNAMEGHARISSWVSGSNTYQVTRRREYGPGAVSTRVRSIGKAKWWTNQPIDTGARTELERRIRQAREELTEIERLVEDAGERKRQLLQEAKELRIKEREIKKEKEEKQRAVVAYRGLPDRLENHKAKLKTIDDQVRELRKETNEMRSKQDELALTQAQATVEHAVRHLPYP